MSSFFDREPTQRALLAYLAETENIFCRVLGRFDPEATCKIFPCLDLGFPHDVVRIAGGFPTGVLVTWSCEVPVIPVDTTVNVCTSSLFELSSDISDQFTEEIFSGLSEKLARSSYRQNFQRGNHFISLTKSTKTGRYFLILHSSAAEFKKGFNGLYPVPGNWYYDKIQVYASGTRYLRYISGRQAEFFCRIASQIPLFNEVRHEFVAEAVVGNLCCIESVQHRHHYYMPSDRSVMIGGFLAQPREVLPIFTFPGYPIFLYRAGDSTINYVTVPGVAGLLLPHGWGKRSEVEPLIEVNFDKSSFLLNGKEFSIDVSVSLRDHPNLSLRRHNIEDGTDNYFASMQPYCPGEVVDRLDQVASFSKQGFVQWRA